MEKSYISGQSISITNPSQLVLSVDEFFRLSKKVPSYDERLKEKEESVFSYLGERKTSKYPKIMMFELDLERIAKEVNEKYSDGFDLDDDYDIVHSPRSTYSRTKPQLPPALNTTQELSPNRIKSVKVGNFKIVEQNPVSINKTDDFILALANYQESTAKTR